MKLDQYSQPIFQSHDLLNLLYNVDDIPLEELIVDKDPDIEQLYAFAGYSPRFESASNYSVEEFDNLQKNKWRVPKDILRFDIRSFCISQCVTDVERTRVNEELVAFAERDLLPVLNVLKYIVDTLRANNIVWGVGRGSSVSSFVLFVIGVHKINSIKYGLDFREFLR